MPDPSQVRAMFGRIAGRYDLLNRVLSLGIDRGWRKRAVAAAGELGRGRVLDVCCGTGDLALAFARRGARVVGADFTGEMLSLARAKQGTQARAGARGGALFVQADALRLPVASAAFDVACVAFGLRNVADRQAGLRELARAVRPGGRVLVLEFSMPRQRLLGLGYRFYFAKLLPRIGGLVSGDRAAYAYLPATVQAWPDPASLAREMQAAGLERCEYELLSGGIACLHSARTPGAPA